MNPLLELGPEKGGRGRGELPPAAWIPVDLFSPPGLYKALRTPGLSSVYTYIQSGYLEVG